MTASWWFPTALETKSKVLILINKTTHGPEPYYSSAPSATGPIFLFLKNGKQFILWATKFFSPFYLYHMHSRYLHSSLCHFIWVCTKLLSKGPSLLPLPMTVTLHCFCPTTPRVILRHTYHLPAYPVYLLMIRVPPLACKHHDESYLFWLLYPQHLPVPDS